jgi:hypothetical protein
MFVAAILVGQTAEATLSIVKSDHFDMNWYFRNTSTKYTGSSPFVGYYRDYDNDGLPDYLILLKDPQNHDWRLFTLNTAPTRAEKTYPTHRTAGRDITARLKGFVPQTLHMPEAPSMDSPDLVVCGTNDVSTDTRTSYFTKFIFWRLKKTTPAFPTELTWAIDVVSTDTPRVYWPNVSFDGDDYPDFLIYNSNPNGNRMFVISCYNGRTGARIWTRALSLDPQDPGTGIVWGMGKAVIRSSSFPTLSVYVLPHQPERGIVGDFDGNGKPEIFLFYTFGQGSNFTTYSMTTNINLLNSSGNFISPYTSTWTRFSRVSQTTVPPSSMTITDDYNRDGFVDLMIYNEPRGGAVLPLFQGYNLKARQFMFEALNSDFGPAAEDTYSFSVMDELDYFGGYPADVNGDRWSDLVVYRSSGFGGQRMALRVGMFNAYAGGGALRGRKMWLRQFDNFNRAFPFVNDFNGDNLSDYVLVREPAEPSSPTVGQVTWQIANTAVSATGIALGKQFTYSPAHSFPWIPDRDSFAVFPLMFSRFGDLDGDGQRDTLGSLSCSFDAGSNETIDLSYGHVFIYDNTPGLATPPLTAELIFRVQNEDWTPLPMFHYANSLLVGHTLVDNNRDGYLNDLIVDLGRAVYSMSFQYRVFGGPPKIEAAALSDFDNNGADAGDQLLLSMDRGVTVTASLLRPSHFFLPVQGDSLGGSGFRVDVNPRNSRQIALTLGQGAHLTVPGAFSMLKRTSGAPSGIDFATSLPLGVIRSFEGISATNGGAPDKNDSGVDIQFNMVGRSGSFGRRGGSLSVVNSPDAAYTHHQLIIPANTLIVTPTLGLTRPAFSLGAPGALQVTSSLSGIKFTTSATLQVEYHEGDIDWDSGYIEGEMRVHQLVEKPLGVFAYVPVPGRQWLGTAFLRSAVGPRKFADQSSTVSASLNNLNPGGSLGAPGVFAGLPIETVDERSIAIKPGIGPGSGGGVVRGGAAVLAPGSQGAYTLHQLEFPGYVTTSVTDPQRVVIRMRTATLAERYAPTIGQSFPNQSGAVFVVTASDANGLPISFTSPVNVTIQFKERPDPALSDVVCFDGKRSAASNMSLVRDKLAGGDVDFGFDNAPAQAVNAALGTVTVNNYIGLTGPDGMGTFGAVATLITPVVGWQQYR